MRFVLLTSKRDSPYDDTSSKYEYPSRYQRFFEPLQAGEPMIAIIYEPRSGGSGRMSYVGWAALHGAPVRSPRLTESGRPLWEVHYVDRVQEFPNPIHRDYLGEPLERWLRDMAVENRNVLSSGASVRWLEEDEGRLILELGHAGQLGVSATIRSPTMSMASFLSPSGPGASWMPWSAMPDSVARSWQRMSSSVRSLASRSERSREAERHSFWTQLTFDRSATGGPTR